MASEREQERRTVTVRIQGRVQGVFFRAWTEQTARSLGLDGWVRNRRDGSVEAVFFGHPNVVAAMLKRCADGSPDAKVEEVVVTEEGGAVAHGFKVLPTH